MHASKLGFFCNLLFKITVIRCISAFCISFPDATVLVFIAAYFMKCQPSVGCSRSIVSDQSHNIKEKNLNSWLIFVLHCVTNIIKLLYCRKKQKTKQHTLITFSHTSGFISFSHAKTCFCTSFCGKESKALSILENIFLKNKIKCVQ